MKIKPKLTKDKKLNINLILFPFYHKSPSVGQSENVNKKVFQLTANRPFADSTGYIVNWLETCPGGGGGCPRMVRSKLNKFKHDRRVKVRVGSGRVVPM